MSLAKYHAKRNFSRTAEPVGREDASGRGRALTFVIQKHAARRLHYDFRLEMEGVLKSWAVPKGVPVRKGDKRLAMEVEDHPLEYGSFEGTIPEGNYGAGTVMLWDNGTYQLIEGDPEAAWRAGKLVFKLSGKKLKGQWTLVRMRHSARESGKPWLLIKTDEDARPLSARAGDTSVKSGKTMKQIAGAKKGPTWLGNKSEDDPSHGRRSQVSNRVNSTTQALPAAAPKFIEPMKARLDTALPKGNDWLFEVKLDGIRAIAIKNNASVRLFSRLPREITGQHPDIVEALHALPAKQLVLDGEIVALDEQGRSSFQLLQNLKNHHTSHRPVFFYVFDLLNVEGRDLRDLPLVERKAALEQLFNEAPEPLRFSASIEANASELWTQVKRLGLEGIIAKRCDSTYEAGRRSGAWLKIKAQNEQEFVIGGYTPPQGTRKHFGAVLVGYYRDDTLLFASKVGTGFDMATLESLYRLFQKYKTNHCPFANLPARRAGHSSQGIPPAEMRRCTWVEPNLVCQVRFLEWTRDGNLRQPVFLGLREDKKPEEVVRETSAIR